MKTFNGKSLFQNLIAIILGVIGMYVLMMSWMFHLIVQLFTMPRDKLIDPFQPQHMPVFKEYKHPICRVLCNAEAIMIHQLGLLREGFGQEYCGEDKDDA